MPRRDGVSPVALALSTTTLAFGSATLAIAALLVVLGNVEPPADDTWLALLGLVPIAAMMLLAHYRSGFGVMAAYLVVGTLSILFFAFVIIANAPDAALASPFLLALPQIAMIYTIAPTVLEVRSIVFIAAAYLLGQAAVLAAAVALDRYPAFDLLTTVAAAVVLVTALSNLVIRGQAAVDRRAVERARRDADASAYQQELETQVVALFHDTVLSELTVLAQQEPGPLDPPLRTALHRDLARIAEGAWWPVSQRGGAAGPAATGGGDAVNEAAAILPRGIARVVAASAADGVLVTVLGDVASLHRFTPAVGAALEQALTQALVNVRQHSGVDRAELVVDGAPDAVAVMIADAGAGFDQSAVPADRFGVARSIVGRIRDVGGRTQVYTSPGNGTAYLFTLPVAAEHTWPARDDAADAAESPAEHAARPGSVGDATDAGVVS